MRILMIRTGGVGDFILTLPVIQALHRAWPDAHLEILGRPGIAVLGRPFVTAIASIDDRRFARLFSEACLEPSDPGAAYLSSFDLVISFLGGEESDFARKLRSRVPRVFFIPPPASGMKHAAVHFVECLDHIVARLSSPRPPAPGESGHNSIPEIELWSEDLQEGERLLKGVVGETTGQPRIIVHPGSGGRRKNWPPQLFAQTIRLLVESQFPVILLQGEADEATVREVIRHLGHLVGDRVLFAGHSAGDSVRTGDSVHVLKDTSLARVAGAIACSHLVIGNDSGISHLAAAVGTPLVCLFGPTDPAVWRPRGRTVRVLTFSEATPAQVYAEGMKLLGRLKRTSPD